MTAAYARVPRLRIDEIRAANSATKMRIRCTQNGVSARIEQMAFVSRAFLALGITLTLVAPVAAAESLDQTINYLFDCVANSKATFIRNGSEHTPAEALDHIKAKYAHFKGDIKTPEDFIRLAASKSLLTGKPYLVRTPNGKEMQLDAWLTDALRAHRAATHS